VKSQYAEGLVTRINAVGAALDEVEGLPEADDLIATLRDDIRRTQEALRSEYLEGLETIVADIGVAGARLAISLRENDLGDGIRFSDIHLSDLGTLYGHFSRAWDEIPEEWKIS
jgi:hypothetical protein